MNYEDMSDFEINKLVAGIVTDGDVIDYCDMFKGPTDDCVQVIYKIGIHGEHYDYCNNPSDAWPIIVENKINIEWRNSMRLHPLAKGTGGNSCHWSDKNPLRAAMICFLKMKDAESE